MVKVALVTVAGKQLPLQLDASPVSAGALGDAAAAALALEPGRFKLLLRGAAVPTADRGARVALQDGDVLVVVPQRRAPTEAAAAAAAEALGAAPPRGGGGDGDDDDDEDGPLRFRLAADAPAWHRALAAFLRDRCGAPDLALSWLFLVGPRRIGILFAVLAGARVASSFGLGPLYLMAAIVVTVFANLGERRPGEQSAYSVFNRGVARLPGELDAGAIDDAIRRGAGIG
ncbi:hypothetical protein Rsub_12166 [Raphidocelis subcapitata]|uniref:SAYSvFN domain-containing protein n=1 Tax=Raphidocelis subcapitata TaxID=307507 RepID=A0A2V0PK22_9CHLO|nr:hypothetical protein Rsub_12166 [Raphidocelis subcapitata]|eukprot:GBF99362.1 hypothetical protein Rsub_12166 [Raphidocelis subcapitata]